VVNTTRVLPELDSGGFGADRDGIVKRRECGQGHCGDDITGPIGRPIVAVADGVVVHVEWSRNGADGHSGRYVKIEHADGTTTAYMHLNSIAAGLERGDRVLAGQQIGTLGRTAVHSAPPHLHFALTVPNGTTERYVDPAPYLVRAKVLEAADRRPAQKPAW
jgi:murein DD-endopeptidase MepM/ murein hydrolase activator NlpD